MPQRLDYSRNTSGLTSRGLRLHIPLLKNYSDGTYSAFLYCRMQPEKSLVCISLVQFVSLGNGQESSLSGVYMVDCMSELRAHVCVLY